MTKTRPWSYTAGRHGNKVRVYERPNGVIYVAVWDVVGGQGRGIAFARDRGERQGGQ